MIVDTQYVAQAVDIDFRCVGVESQAGQEGVRGEVDVVGRDNGGGEVGEPHLCGTALRGESQRKEFECGLALCYG